MTRFKLFFAFFFILINVSLNAQSSAEEQWESMFNGKDLSKWKPKIRNHAAGDNFGNTFRVEDGKLVVRYDAYDKFSCWVEMGKTKERPAICVRQEPMWR